MRPTWILRTVDDAAVTRLSRELGLLPTTARILVGRGIISEDAARTYLAPTLGDLANPGGLPDIDTAATRLADALERGERIALFGDYDVDGVSGTALLARFLRECGTDPIVALPSRAGEGYGLSAAAVDALAEQGATLLVTIDNGTRSVAEVAHARSRGLEVIVTDHHLPGERPPDALAHVNPQRLPQGDARRELCGCGVAFMLAATLRAELRRRGRLPDPEPNLRRHLDLVALGTIADIVPLTGSNRILTQFGLAEIAATTKPGLRALMAVSGTAPEEVRPGAVAFRLGPRLNAAGRIGDAREAFELLLTDDAEAAHRIAMQLDRANRERQKLEERARDDIERMLAREPELAERGGVVLASERWHVGILGIVAAKVAGWLGRPAVVISTATDPARGSARSGGDVDLGAALARCAETLERFGGHAMAAGLSVRRDRLEAFVDAFDAACRALAPAPAPKCLALDAEVAAAEITPELVEQIAACQPFGAGNPEPLLAAHDLDVLDRRIVGNGHLRLTLGAGGARLNAIGFNLGDRLAEAEGRLSAAFLPEFNTWNGVISIQLKIKDLRPAGNL